ncbi:MAG: hypothetical protein QF926_13835 [Alphaproteobacteria bacterium]|jgi:hypothetical protein|nr:hypothetical protein [Alphaproteobacteria bacterium]MDP6517681.1 hypothetical protein [Alphaproteobacteria bacterium]
MSLRSDFGGFESRRRSRIAGRLFRFLILAAIVGAFSYWSYNLGGERAERTNRALRESMTLLTDENERLRHETDAAVAARIAADERAGAYQRQYVAEVPQGPAKQVMALVNERIESGVSPDRVAFVVAAVENETRCEPEIASRRFLIQTPLTSSENSVVTFADNTISVTGLGVASRDGAGNVEAWFDPAAPVAITFTLIGGRNIDINGKLPLHHSVVIDDSDHRFAITPGQTKGFVVVTEQRCAYP